MFVVCFCLVGGDGWASLVGRVFVVSEKVDGRFVVVGAMDVSAAGDRAVVVVSWYSFFGFVGVRFVVEK